MCLLASKSLHFFLGLIAHISFLSDFPSKHLCCNYSDIKNERYNLIGLLVINFKESV